MIFQNTGGLATFTSDWNSFLLIGHSITVQNFIKIHSELASNPMERQTLTEIQQPSW